MTTKVKASLRLGRTLDAAVEDVYTALTSRDAIATWFGPRDDYRVTVHEWNCTIGGSYRVEFNTPEDETHTCHGEFKEIVPQKKVTYTWSWEGQPPIDTRVTFEVEARRHQTQLTLVHEGFPAIEMRDHHKQGWTASLQRLARTLA